MFICSCQPCRGRPDESPLHALRTGWKACATIQLDEEAPQGWKGCATNRDSLERWEGRGAVGARHVVPAVGAASLPRAPQIDRGDPVGRPRQRLESLRLYRNPIAALGGRLGREGFGTLLCTVGS